MKEGPLISIVLPVYNGEKYLGKAIKSCINQTYKNLEIIIIDDYSTDSSLYIAEEFSKKDSRIKIIKNNSNEKLPVCLNIGHKIANGKFITWTSDDNIYQKEAINTLYQTIVEEKADIVYSEYLLIDESGNLIGQSNLNSIEFLLFNGVIGACFLYKKEVYERNEGYREDLVLVEDYDFWIRALKHSIYFKINNPGYYYYRYHPNSLTVKIKSNPLIKEEFLKNLKTLYNEFFNQKGLKNKDLIIEFLIDRYLNGHNRNLMVLEPGFLKEMEIISSSLINFSSDKIKRLLLFDVVETILKNGEYQNLNTLIKLHIAGRSTLLRLPIERYLAVIKKCMF